MSFLTILALSLLAGLAYWSRRRLGAPQFERPIVVGTLTGLIMGDLKTGMAIGGTLELVFLGAAAIGGTPPPNGNIGTVLGAAFAINAGAGLDEALVIAVPAAILGSFLETAAKGLSSVFVGWAESAIEKKNDKSFLLSVAAGNFAHFLSNFIPTFVALYVGAGAATALMESIPSWAQDGLTAVSHGLPALGFGLMLATIANKKLLPYFFIGFLVAVFAGFGVLGTSLLGFLVALLVVGTKAIDGGKKKEGSEAKPNQIIDKEDKKKFFWRSFALQAAFSFDRMQAMGFTYTLQPFLRKIYKDDEKYYAALQRHLSFFNTNPWVVGPIVALASTMEKQKAEGEEVEVEAIQAVKTSLMGPLAGIGDSVIFGIYRPIISGITATMAVAGSVAGPILFVVALNVVHFLFRYYSQELTFRRGVQFVMDLGSKENKRIMEGATIAGLMSIGSLVGSWLNIKTPLAYTVQEAVIEVQSALDGILPRLLGLLATVAVYLAVKRGRKANSILIFMAVALFVAGALGILI